MTRLRLLPVAALVATLGACGDGTSTSADASVTPGDASASDVASRGDASAATDGPLCQSIPLRVNGNLTVGPGCVLLTGKTEVRTGTLTIQPGSRVQAAAGAFLSAEDDDAAVVAVGTAAQPIVFTSANANPQPGDWQCLFLKSSNSELQHVEIKFGGQPCAALGSNPAAALVVAGSVRGVRNVKITDSANYGVLLNPGVNVRGFENNTFARNGKPSIRTATSELVKIGGGNVFEKANDDIEVDTTFGLDAPGTIKKQPVAFRMTGTFNIGAAVAIEPGVVLRLTGEGLIVFGTGAHLEAVGTAADKITFTSTNANPQPGDWGCLDLVADSGGPRLEHVVVEYGGGARCTGATDRRTAIYADPDLQLRHSTIRRSGGFAVEAREPCAPKAAEWCANTFDMNAATNIVCTFAKTPLACM